jgi:VIT1/CCC1 family predicted Fe2+/Mn2+ transporter
LLEDVAVSEGEGWWMKTDRDPREHGETRLARAVRATLATAAASSTRHVEHHRKTNWLRDVILGGQDGLVNILGIILGVIAGGGSKTVLLTAGFAAAITESISMGAVGYTSSVSQRDYYQAERAREAMEIDTMPEAERQEIREIYATKGFAGDLLERVVDTITANRDSWLATMMDEELHLQPVETADIIRSAVVITIATLIGHLIPLLPFVWMARTPALVLAIVLSALVLFGVGVYSAVSLVGDWRKSGLRMLVIGLGAAGVGFLIGSLFHAAGA